MYYIYIYLLYIDYIFVYIQNICIHILSSNLPIPAPMALQFNLRRASKARIDRMCAPKQRRKDLIAPQYVMDEWKNGDKNAMAALLEQVNWQKDSSGLDQQCILNMFSCSIFFDSILSYP